MSENCQDMVKLLECVVRVGRDDAVGRYCGAFGVDVWPGRCWSWCMERRA